MIGKVGRAQQSSFLACERNEQNRSFPFIFIHRGQPGEFKHARRSRCIVVGSVVNLADLRRRKRVPIPQSEMIVMRADDDPFVL